MLFTVCVSSFKGTPCPSYGRGAISSVSPLQGTVLKQGGAQGGTACCQPGPESHGDSTSRRRSPAWSHTLDLNFCHSPFLWFKKWSYYRARRWVGLAEEMSSEHQVGGAMVVGSIKLLFLRRDHDKHEKLKGGNSGHPTLDGDIKVAETSRRLCGAQGLLQQGASG